MYIYNYIVSVCSNLQSIWLSVIYTHRHACCYGLLPMSVDPVYSYIIKNDKILLKKDIKN